MATEVKHGPRPKFTVKLQVPDAVYHIVVTGHYTKKDGVAAAGVSEVVWQSQRPAKQRAELLSLRSAFVGWFLEAYLERGGTWDEAVNALRHYPFARVRAGLRRHRKQIVKRWARPVRWYDRARWALREWRETPASRPWWFLG